MKMPVGIQTHAILGSPAGCITHPLHYSQTLSKGIVTVDIDLYRSG